VQSFSRLESVNLISCSGETLNIFLIYPTDSEFVPRDFKTEQFGIAPARIP
jgi:hypothetical protein